MTDVYLPASTRRGLARAYGDRARAELAQGGQAILYMALASIAAAAVGFGLLQVFDTVTGLPLALLV